MASPILVDRARTRKTPTPIHVVSADTLKSTLSKLGKVHAQWAKSNRFTADGGQVLTLPDGAGGVEGVLFGVHGAASRKHDRFAAGALPKELPEGLYEFSPLPKTTAKALGFVPDMAALAWLLGSYTFSQYRKPNGRPVRLAVSGDVDIEALTRIADGANLARELINMPANDMGPDEIERAARDLAGTHKAKVRVIRGEALLEKNFPLIHAVGRASVSAPRLIDMTWGRAGDPRVTLAGKGVSFDTGGLNLKPGNSMAIMKKDMGGAANVLGLASMIMASGLRVRLRVLIPAVENSVAGNAFRPGDVYPSRNGMTVEIGNTDAEGRLVLADALTLADEEKPDLLIDMATLTGAARVALGPDLPPYYTDDEDLAVAIAASSQAINDPLWRMPFWNPYDGWLSSRIADVNHITDGGFAGSMTAALFLRRFVEKTPAYVHFDIYGWTPKARPALPHGGAAQGIRALFDMMSKRYGR